VKSYGDEVEQRLADFATGTIEMDGLLDRGSKEAPLAGRLGRLHIASPGFTLGGGTSEIMRNIIAMRGLGLPRQ
jgi:hypothetical protein